MDEKLRERRPVRVALERLAQLGNAADLGVLGLPLLDRADRGGARAPDSLVYLALATMQLGNKAKACEALEEFRLVYPSEAGGRLAGLSTDTAKKAGCK